MDSSSEDKGAAMAIPPLKPGEKFHLFVSYSSMDATWTHGLIGRLEADHAGLRVCLHERDFTPGRNILENMAECIHQSQKVLLVLSQDFVQSRWCLLEADLSLFGYCLERKPVIPVLLRPCQVPLHLSHLTYLEAVDSRFYSKVAQLLCTPSHCMVRSLPGPRPVPSLYSGKTLLTLNCVNRDSLPSWKVGTFSTLSVPDPLKEVLPDPELEDCRRTFLQAPEGEALFREALLQFSSAYACCLVQAHFPHCEDTTAARGHLEPGLCFCQYVSVRLERAASQAPAGEPAPGWGLTRQADVCLWDSHLREGL
ncbi:uncharacterized protein LOC114232532 isoform X1 [Eptesicus fuscus]|uniref:uncharacterized protein LOC114232532 isoform X1 n=1 Tax=Eptesicus fuscus TaxID=29078 RepID=UPI002403A76E|nr:uncharacterized protein LOC114232532 isoform X1 [Eptesicus fuscus]